MLVGAVGIQKFAADIDYLFAVPVHDEPRLGLDLRHGHCLEIFFISQREESVNIVRLNNNRHALLALAYCKLRAVETLVFFRHCVEVYLKSVRELAYSYRYAARAEVVAAFYHQAGIFISEEPLELSLLGGRCPSEPPRRSFRAIRRCVILKNPSLRRSRRVRSSRRAG